MTKLPTLPASQTSFVTDLSPCTQGERVTDKTIDQEQSFPGTVCN